MELQGHQPCWSVMVIIIRVLLQAPYIPSIQKNVVVHSQIINDVSTNNDGTSKSSDIPVGFTTRTKDRTNVMPTRTTQSGGLPQYMLTFSLGKLQHNFQQQHRWQEEGSWQMQWSLGKL